MDLLALGAAFAVLATVLVLSLAFYAGAAVGVQVRGRLEGVLAGSTSVVEGDAVTALRETRSPLGLIRLLFSGAWLERLQRELQEADSQLQPTDFVAIRFALAGISFVVPYLFPGGLIGLMLGFVAAALGFLAPRLWLDQRRAARSKKLEEQLPEALTLVSNSLKAGFGLLQALNLAADQLEHPIATELAQTIHEMNVGSSAEEALTNLAERSSSYDLDLVVTAILVQRSVGGNLAEILDTVASTMRERVRIRGEIQTLTAQQRMTGVIIGLLPLAVGGIFMIISPDYITLLFTETTGRVMLGAAAVLEAVGIVAIRRILTIEV